MPGAKKGPGRPKGSRNAKAGARGRAADARSTRERILAVATREFSARGYDGARVEEIVRRSRVSKNLLYYYFGSKEKLFIQSLERAYEAVQSRQAAVSLDGLDPVESVRRLISETFHHLAEVPEFIGLLNSENLHKAVHLAKSEHLRGAYPPMALQLNELLERGRETGDFRDDANAVDLYIAISAMAYHALSNQYTLSVLFDRDFTSPDEVAWRIEHITEVVLGYLLHKPDARSGRKAAQSRGGRLSKVD